MPLPLDFNRWEHFQNVLIKTHNKEVKEYFRGTPDDDITTPKGSLKAACLIDDNDTIQQSMAKMYFFDVKVGGLQQAQVPVYGIPVEDYHRDIKFRPQIKLVFESTPEPDDPSRHHSEITFRLTDETSDSISRTKAEILARNIRDEFTKPTMLTWKKGWYKYTYLDQEKGYDLRLLVRNKSEGEKIAKKVVAIQNHIFDNDNAQFVEHDRSYPVNQGTHRVYGTTLQKPRRRPVVDVVFRYAQLFVWGRIHPINLVAGWSARMKSPIIRV